MPIHFAAGAISRRSLDIWRCHIRRKRAAYYLLDGPREQARAPYRCLERLRTTRTVLYASFPLQGRKSNPAATITWGGNSHWSIELVIHIAAVAPPMLRPDQPFRGDLIRQPQPRD